MLLFVRVQENQDFLGGGLSSFVCDARAASSKQAEWPTLETWC